MKTKKRKILVSPGFGAGWSSWADNREIAKFMLEYQPLIEFLENGGVIEDSYDNRDLVKNNPILAKFAEECQEKFGEVPYLGGARDLRVREVGGRVRINEYDGSESVEEEGEYSEWL